MKALRIKKAAESRLFNSLAPWILEIRATYRMGNKYVNADVANQLSGILKSFYMTTSRAILGFDIREYKQLDDSGIAEMRSAIARQLDQDMYQHNITSCESVLKTSNEIVSRISDLALVNGWTELETKQALINRMRAHSLTIATTEAQWVTEATREAAILIVNDPLQNTVGEIVNLIRSGDTNAAVRLSRQVMKIARQPLSISQGELINTIRENMTVPGARTRLMTPLVQGRVIASLEARGESLGRLGKEWSAIGDDKTRPEHEAANGQQRALAEPFIVGGDRLQYPGDGSLGASLANIINCRCACVYI